MTDHERKLEIQKIGESLACFHLVADGYSDVHNLNYRIKSNFPFADVAGTKGGVTSYFSVKGRNRFTNKGRINSSYKIGGLRYAESYERELGVVCEWIAVSIDTEKGIYSCYHGSVPQLLKGRSGLRRIGMTASAIVQHEAFAVDVRCPYDVSKLKNTIRRPQRSKTASSHLDPSDAEIARLRVEQLRPILARIGIFAPMSR